MILNVSGMSMIWFIVLLLLERAIWVRRFGVDGHDELFSTVSLPTSTLRPWPSHNFFLKVLNDSKSPENTTKLLEANDDVELKNREYLLDPPKKASPRLITTQKWVVPFIVVKNTTAIHGSKAKVGNVGGPGFQFVVDSGESQNDNDGVPCIHKCISSKSPKDSNTHKVSSQNKALDSSYTSRSLEAIYISSDTTQSPFVITNPKQFATPPNFSEKVGISPPKNVEFSWSKLPVITPQTHFWKTQFLETSTSSKILGSELPNGLEGITEETISVFDVINKFTTIVPFEKPGFVEKVPQIPGGILSESTPRPLSEFIPPTNLWYKPVINHYGGSYDADLKKHSQKSSTFVLSIWAFENDKTLLVKKKYVPYWILDQFKVRNNQLININDIPHSLRNIVISNVKLNQQKIIRSKLPLISSGSAEKLEKNLNDIIALHFVFGAWYDDFINSTDFLTSTLNLRYKKVDKKLFNSYLFQAVQDNTPSKEKEEDSWDELAQRLHEYYDSMLQHRHGQGDEKLIIEDALATEIKNIPGAKDDLLTLLFLLNNLELRKNTTEGIEGYQSEKVLQKISPGDFGKLYLLASPPTLTPATSLLPPAYTSNYPVYSSYSGAYGAVPQTAGPLGDIADGANALSANLAEILRTGMKKGTKKVRKYFKKKKDKKKDWFKHIDLEGIIKHKLLSWVAVKYAPVVFLLLLSIIPLLIIKYKKEYYEPEAQYVPVPYPIREPYPIFLPNKNNLGWNPHADRYDDRLGMTQSYGASTYQNPEYNDQFIKGFSDALTSGNVNYENLMEGDDILKSSASSSPTITTVHRGFIPSNYSELISPRHTFPPPSTHSPLVNNLKAKLGNAIKSFSANKYNRDILKLLMSDSIHRVNGLFEPKQNESKSSGY